MHHAHFCVQSVHKVVDEWYVHINVYTIVHPWYTIVIRVYSFDVIKILRATEATRSVTSKALPRRFFMDTPGSGDYTLRIIRSI